MRLADPEATTPRVTFRKGTRKVTVEQFDNLWRREITDVEPAELIIDLGYARFIDQEFLLYLIGFLLERKRSGYSTRINLPNRSDREESGRDRPVEFLMAWNFPDALAKTLGGDFTDYLTDDSADRFSAMAGKTPRYDEIVRLPDGKTDVKLPRKFFKLTPIALADGGPVAATLVKKDWLDLALVAVLDRFFENLDPEEGLGSRVGSYILHEAVLNAASHPKARASMTSAQIENTKTRKGGRAPGDLILVVWDDGISFAETLAAVGQKTSRSFGLVDDKFSVTISDHSTGKTEKYPLNANDPRVLEEPHTLALAAFMLGVTSVQEGRTISPDARATYAHMDESTLR